jgi:hypothetical protein
MTSTVQAVRAEALFASTVQASEAPGADQVRRAVAATLRQLGVPGCAAWVAAEYGDHPDTAPARMRWALGAVGAAYPALDAPRRRSRTVTRPPYQWSRPQPARSAA